MLLHNGDGVNARVPAWSAGAGGAADVGVGVGAGVGGGSAAARHHSQIDSANPLLSIHDRLSANVASTLSVPPH
jgi:hypothetical protein